MKLTLFSEKLGRAQTTHPWRFLAAAALITVVAGVGAAGLRLDATYEALLPKGSPELENVEAVRNRTGGTRQIVLAIGGKDPDVRIAFGHKLQKALKTVDNITTTHFEFDVDFFLDRGLWLMDPATLDDLIPRVEEAVRIAKWQANPMHLHLDEEAERAELEAAWKRVDEIVEKKRSNLVFERILTSKDNRYTFLLVVPSICFSDMKTAPLLLKQIHAKAQALNPSAYGLEIKTASNIDVLQEQHKTMSQDLRNASVLALILGILVIATFSRGPKAPFVIGIPLVAGVVWTFALARMFLEHVNLVTGFLVAVLIGLGIDFGVHLFIRFQQEHRSAPLKEAVVRATTETLPPALTSALTTAGTFFSFTIADFRGFSEFGLTAGIGVMMTMASHFLILPPLVMVLGERGRTASKPSPRSAGIKMDIISPVIAWGVVLVLGFAAVFGAFHMGDIPFRNNFKLLRGKSEATEFLDYVNSNLGVGTNPAVIIVKNIDQAFAVAATAREQKKIGRKNGIPSRMGRVFSISDLLPKNQDALRPGIEKLRKILDDPKLDRAEKKGGKRADQLARARKMVKTEPWGEDEIPKTFLNRLKTLDNSEYLVFVWPKERNDADYQAAAWEGELNELLDKIDKQDISYQMADETLIVAWIFKLIEKDGLPLLLMAAIVVLIFLALDLRSFKQVVLIAFPLAVGMGSFAFIIYLWGLELNMFNLIVIPSIIGIGIDNAVHIFHRYRSEGKGSVMVVIRTTGMAALLASLTTGIGFGSALVSQNLGLRSLGSMAIIGILATFVASTIFFPCLLSLLDRQKKSKKDKL